MNSRASCRLGVGLVDRFAVLLPEASAGGRLVVAADGVVLLGVELVIARGRSAATEQLDFLGALSPLRSPRLPSTIDLIGGGHFRGPHDAPRGREKTSTTLLFDTVVSRWPPPCEADARS